MPKPRAASLALAAAGLGACASAPTPSPAEIADACVLLKENRDWYGHLRESARDWGAPMGLQLAIIRQESGFDADARPARGRSFFGLLPGKRPSDAYGYAQALDSTWERYQKETGNTWSSRDDFEDATDFVGWYVNLTGRMTGVGQHDYRDHYLAYHEGQGGYMRGTWRSKGWLIKTADTVAANAARYERQIKDCDGLRRRFLGVF
jgi:hypothetical protein